MKVVAVGAVLGLFACAVCLAVTALDGQQRLKEALEAAIAYIEAQGDNAMVAYLGFTFVGVVLLVPTTPMEFAGGFLFATRYGVYATWALTSVAKLVANVVSVWLARNVFRDFVKRHFVERWDVLRLVSNAIRDEPFKMAFLVRGSMVPLAVKNYGLGVLDVGYVPNAAASCIFTPFYVYQNIYLGSACQDLKEIFAARSAAASGEPDALGRIKAVLPLVFNICLVLFLIRTVKQQIKKSRLAMEESLKAKVEKKVE